MQTSFQHPVRLLRHVECFGGKTCRVCLAERLLLTGEMVAGKTEAVPFFNQGKCVFVIYIYIWTYRGVNGWRHRVGVTGGVWIVDLVCGCVTWLTVGWFVISKVFLGESTMVDLGCAQCPGPSHRLRKCFVLFRGQLHGFCLSFCAFWLAWHAWERHECWLFHTEPGTLSAGRMVYWGRGRTKSTKRNRSQRWV